ncbi:type I-G CRISPR-associated RAMP protein Csb1/Cas7g [Chloracidobacterium thermophilum]|uniref:CRISPR-associated protein GSU0053 (Cas_GSU0053) n=1 Tax=Chloracidobacterium thermophilum (strain B) TaxID=981222 RepID=G2LJY4_CHLTF|nr:type I-U CRISPR-associated RAMP protein Csb1/Cas7u [Chloracidobacterium thermophilum]AEP13151.1 CRISPR-associated protein GSU0053 (Cas_GSU0053) [Chloracidobacterium thermophilum B]QUV80414.1 type I-U CRISPR-associated protein Cas7 [Chloracidobacterium thermophilum]
MTTTPAQSQAQSLLDQLYAQYHIVITASLKLTNGNFLQPTGFPDIGACIYRDKEGRRWCLVESEQSMANRLEAVCMKAPGVWVDDLRGLPVIAVKDKGGKLLATNLTEPHRIASSYILESELAGGNKNLRKLFEEKIGLENRPENNGDFWPMDRRADLERLVFALDPSALLHGFQFVQWKFVGLRQTRLVHARLEAELADDPEVHYVMVKWDGIEPESTRKERANKGQSIAAKSRIVPKNITATFEIDLLALRSLSLADDRKKFLLGLALWKIGAFLNNNQSFDPRSRSTGPSLRLRADCYLTCESISWSGNSSKGQTTPTELMEAKPTGLGQAEGPSFLPDTHGNLPDTHGNDDGKQAGMSGVTFSALIKELLSDKKDEATSGEPKEGKSSAEKGTASGKESSPGNLYDGPMVEVTYDPKQNQENKPKQEKKGGSKAAQQTEANVEQAGEAQE